jgi:hypothetical protein
LQSGASLSALLLFLAESRTAELVVVVSIDSSALSLPIVCGLLLGKVSVILESSDQKFQCFLVPIALKRLFFEHVHNMLGEMSVRT